MCRQHWLAFQQTKQPDGIMSSINKPERATQDRVLKLFTDTLKYRYLGDWPDRAANHCIDEELLTAYLERSGYMLDCTACLCSV